MEEVIGSNPICSTKHRKKLKTENVLGLFSCAPTLRREQIFVFLENFYLFTPQLAHELL